MAQKTTTVIFDCGEVLFRGFYGVEHILSRELERPIRNTDLQVHELEELFLGKITEEEFWETMIARFKWNLSVMKLKDIIRRNFAEIHGTRRIVQQLRNKGYTLAILSVHASEWISHLEERYSFHRLFHQTAYSYHSGFMKPDPRAFRTLMKDLGKEPAECLFIDDHEPNIAAARKLDMGAHLFKRAPDLETELKSLCIL